MNPFPHHNNRVNSKTLIINCFLPGFSVVFDGHPSGEAIVVQGVDLGESVNINLRFEDT